MSDRSKHWVTLNPDATEILSVHYDRDGRLSKVAKEKRAAFVAEAWRNSIPEGEDPAKYQQMIYKSRVFFVDLDNKAALDSRASSIILDISFVLCLNRGFQ